MTVLFSGEADVAAESDTAELSWVTAEGWEYRLVGAVDPALVGNIRWLAGYRYPRHDHPRVAQLLVEVFATPRRNHPASRPDKTFPDTRDHGAMRYTQPSPLSRRRTSRSADWFQLNRRGGSAIPYHRHLTPVMSRDWAPAMDGITATITASGPAMDFGPPRGAMPTNVRLG